MHITRFSEYVSGIAVTAALATTEAFEYRGFAAGMVYVPAGSALTSLTWYAAEDMDGTFQPVYDGATTAIASTVAAGRAVPIPSYCLGAGALKVVGNDAGTIKVSLKG